MTAPQELCEAVFDAMDALVDAVGNAIAADPDIPDPGVCVSSAWLRKDGVSVCFEQAKANELTFVLQVTFDTILAWQAEQEREQGATQ